MSGDVDTVSLAPLSLLNSIVLMSPSRVNLMKRLCNTNNENNNENNNNNNNNIDLLK